MSRKGKKWMICFEPNDYDSVTDEYLREIALDRVKNTLKQDPGTNPEIQIQPIPAEKVFIVTVISGS
jgi:hypothetical protein